MFDLDLQLKIQQARTALKGGRLDEAFSIAIQTGVRSHRGGQRLLEELVQPLSARAEEYLAADRLKEALVDVERAIAAGGQQPEVVALRHRVEEALENEREAARNGAALVASVEGHLARGSLYEGRQQLEKAPPGDPQAERLREEIDRRSKQARARREEGEQRLGTGDLLGAVTAAGEAIRFGGRSERSSDFVAQLKTAVIDRVEQCLREGELRTVAELTSKYRDALGETLEGLRWEDAVVLARSAAGALEAGDLEELWVTLEQLRRLYPKTPWLKETVAEVERAAKALRVIRSGPLAALGVAADQKPSPSPRDPGRTAAAPRRRGTGAEAGPAEGAEAGSSSAQLLWVDGVGTYLILPSERVTIGRQGSSARPDIALTADIAGAHAEIIRTGGDYFVVAGQGEVTIDRRNTQRRLLESGNVIGLGRRSRLEFRLPTSLSTSAVLHLRGGLRLEGNVHHVILLDEHFLMGADDASHVKARGASAPLVIRRREGQLVCRAKEEIRVDGRGVGTEAALPLDAPIQVQDLSFTLTALNALNGGRS